MPGCKACFAEALQELADQSDGNLILTPPCPTAAREPRLVGPPGRIRCVPTLYGRIPHSIAISPAAATSAKRAVTRAICPSHPCRRETICDLAHQRACHLDHVRPGHQRFNKRRACRAVEPGCLLPDGACERIGARVPTSMIEHTKAGASLRGDVNDACLLTGPNLAAEAALSDALGQVISPEEITGTRQRALTRRSVLARMRPLA
jgi:hypothetical protein